jgi:hypothetical protein
MPRPLPLPGAVSGLKTTPPLPEKRTKTGKANPSPTNLRPQNRRAEWLAIRFCSFNFAIAMTRNRICNELTGRSVDDLWMLFLRNVRTLLPFWEQTTRVFAKRLAVPEKGEFHLKVIADAFGKMDDWRFRRIPYVKARRNEIDSAISFMRNKAIVKPIYGLRIAPVARNAAGALRVLLTTSCRGYSDEQLPQVIAGALYDIAAVRVLFPFGFDTLMCFHPKPPFPADVDPFVVTLERAGQVIGIAPLVQALLSEAASVWNSVDDPKPFDFPAAIWSEETDASNALLHYAANAAFHRKR